MSLEQLIQEIEKSASLKANSIIQEAKKEKEKIIKQAKLKAKEIEEQTKQNATNFALAQQKEKLASAQSEKERIIKQAKEEAVLAALDQVWEEFKKYIKDKNYPKYLRKLAAMALEELGEDRDIVFLCNEQDKKLLQNTFKVHQTINCAGGLIAQTKDGKIIVDYTFENIFEQKKQALKNKIMQILFSTDQEPTPQQKKVLKTKIKTTKK
jgi:vacuolar-type H+-ATPase subunit E/Vma4